MRRAEQSSGSFAAAAPLLSPRMPPAPLASGSQPLSLNFQVFESVTLFLTVIMSSMVLSSGKSQAANRRTGALWGAEERGGGSLTLLLLSSLLSLPGDWLYGCIMIISYIIIAGAFWLQRQPSDLK